MELTVVEIVFAVALLAAGIATGILIARRGESGRRRALEDELAHERAERTRYQEAVAQHFGKTSDLFRDLTSQYSALYTHLAEGARDLCADLPSLGQGFTEAPRLIVRETPVVEPEPVPPVDDGTDRVP
ncbi:MAG TPA: DUF1043 family protein [Candidatus Binatia bacterium]|jgi:uncharacterized membrane-anchored protein YhcB (DUF1043 family)|nr:DUF1043 family protein [Candidatus Binatia bacterium]